jgi:hypothetical protein
MPIQTTPKHGETMYNGHKNWNHWNVSLWLFNDERRYNILRQVIENETLEESARILSHIMKGFVFANINGRLVTCTPGLDLEGTEIEAKTTPDGAPWSKTAIRAALVGVR